jgi:hypothetical protein
MHCPEQQLSRKQMGAVVVWQRGGKEGLQEIPAGLEIPPDAR